MGLRERQKIGRHERIVEVADRLFRRHGYAATSIDDIADTAELSPGTVYNYFGTKGAILVALIDRGDVAFIDHQRALLRQLDDDLTEAVAKLLEAIVANALDRLDPETWRHALSHSVLEGGGDLEKGYAACNKRIYDLLGDLLESLVAQGKLAPEFDIATTRGLLEMINHALFEKAIAIDPFDFPDYQSTLRRYLRVVLT